MQNEKMLNDPVLKRAERDAQVGADAPERVGSKPGEDSASAPHRGGHVPAR